MAFCKNVYRNVEDVIFHRVDETEHFMKHVINIFGKVNVYTFVVYIVDS